MGIKGNYVLLPQKPVLIFEVYLPKKMEYLPKLSEVLNSFLRVDSLKSVPIVNKLIQVGRAIGINEVKLIDQIYSLVSGYSIYEVDGRFRSSSGPVDERVLAIRFILQDPEIEDGMRKEIVERAKETIRYLVTKRFAEEIGFEDEIWFVEYQNCLLQKWIKKGQRGRSSK